MFHQLLQLSFVFFVFFFHGQILAQNPDLTYQCRAFGDPHVEAWTLKDLGSNQRPLQHCYSPGFYYLVKNEYVRFQVEVIDLWMVEITLFFLNGTAPNPGCTITSNGFEIYPEDAARCQAFGIIWSLPRTNAGYSLTVSYPKAKFVTEITHAYASRAYAGHYNIYVWQPKSLVDSSTGQCTWDDKQCSPIPRTGESMVKYERPRPQQRAISADQAKAVCEANMNAYLSKTRRAPYQRSLSMNSTIANAMYGCEADLAMTGSHQAASSSLGILVVEELTTGLTSIDQIHQVLESGARDAFETFHEAVKEAEVEVAEIMGLPTPTTVTKASTTSTTPTPTPTPTITLTASTGAVATTSPPRAAFKCSIYQNMYIQTWHPTNEATPPSRTCSSTAASVELVRNKHVRYTLNIAGSSIGELTLILFDGMSPNAVCTLTVVNADPQWMDCEKHGINPSVTTTATHKQLVVYYARANFTTVVKQDIGINIGRFNIDIYQNPDLALQSTGACNLISSCSGGSSGQSKRIR